MTKEALERFKEWLETLPSDPEMEEVKAYFSSEVEEEIKYVEEGS